MIFQQYQQVLDGNQSQTLQLVKSGDYGWACGEERDASGLPVALIYSSVHCATGKVRWERGKTYAVQPGSGQKAVGRIQITNIRRGYIQDISEEDAIAMGMTDTYFDGLPSYKNRIIPGHLCRAALADTWTIQHTKPGERYEDDPEVWILKFELVRET